MLLLVIAYTLIIKIQGYSIFGILCTGNAQFQDRNYISCSQNYDIQMFIFLHTAKEQQAQ